MPVETYRFIAPNPSRSGPAEAVTVEYDIPVWAIVGQLKALNWNVARVASDYAISEDSVNDVLRYYEQHKEAIDARLLANLPPAMTGECDENIGSTTDGPAQTGT